MAEQFLRIGGTDGNIARAFKTDEQGKQVISSKESVVELFFLEQEEIRDTSINSTTRLDLTEFSRVVFIVDNTTDVDIRLRPQADLKFINYYESGQYKSTNSNALVVPSNRQNTIINDVLPRVFNSLYTTFNFSYNALDTPTTGHLTIRLIGLKK